MVVRFKKSRYENDQFRKLLEDPEYASKKSLRVAIEGAISALKRAFGLRRLLVRGLLKVHHFVMLITSNRY
ncbi:hypothetical protein BBF96_05305 [Anoxybacter fermentans]|uniref:Transposase DDE domain-containing protein n=2 Tax=Anoxybacter fermentans TaxID=1323375 RepID=A0A3S9SWY3_9FIRM|nr:hypothetical protein BBF96_05305 [Anoxybacter fermentans]